MIWFHNILLMKSRVVSRNFEMLVGIIGSVIAICTGSFLIFIEHVEINNAPLFGVIAVLAAVLGFISSYYVRKDSEAAGIGFIIAAILCILGAHYLNVMGAVMLLAAGISALFRN